MKKLLKILILIVFFAAVTGFSRFSDIKQPDDKSCGPVVAANSAENILNTKFSPDELIQNFAELAKTDENGTTAQNLCAALEKFFNKSKLKTNIKYYGIRKVEKKYKSAQPLDICKEIQNGSSIILNIGFYKASKNAYKREYGHYVNAYECKAGKILIADPFSKKMPRYIELKKLDGQKLKNTKDNESYSFKKYSYYEVLPAFDYQEPDEISVLNGVIRIYPLFL